MGGVFNLFSPIFIAYSTVYIGLTNFRRLGFLKGADYSYGVFLYHFAIQQAVVLQVPSAQHWYVNAAISLPLTIIFSALSWHFVERPSLSLRFYIYSIESKLVAVFPFITIAAQKSEPAF